MKKLFSLLLTIQLFFYGTGLSVAQAQSEGEDDLIKNTQQDIALVGFAGLGGAVLGLSTLSFVDKPSKHIYNVWTGAALGLIAGVIIVAYNSAQKGSEELQASKDFNSLERFAWHSQNHENLTSPVVPFSTEIWQLSF